MALSNEAIIAIVTLAVMCIPSLLVFYRYTRRKHQEGKQDYSFSVELLSVSLQNFCLISA
jgi:hypothetical protein